MTYEDLYVYDLILASGNTACQCSPSLQISIPGALCYTFYKKMVYQMKSEKHKREGGKGGGGGVRPELILNL